ncbi:hypothetical protein BGX28_005132 [Mortierella sp. GBA30]|nr:hypothetical protein BGX28_005132 [Mortierella sp. GBA30]
MTEPMSISTEIENPGRQSPPTDSMQTSTSALLAPSTRRQSESQLKLNVERNHLTLPLPSFPSSSSQTISSYQPSKYPSIPRFTPATPSRRSGNNTPSNGIRLGTYSASNSPPGTPPSGLRNHYLNAAYNRSHNYVYSMGSAPGSSATLYHQPPKPHVSIVVPQQATSPSRVQSSAPGSAAHRSYSADHLQVDDLEITVTTPGGSNSTENHVMTLQRALSKLVESDSREEEGEADGSHQEDGPMMMRGSKLSSASSSPPDTPPHKRKGVAKYPKIVIDRLDPEKVAAVSKSLTHGAGASDETLAQQTEISEELELRHRDTDRDKGKDKDKDKDKDRKNARNSIAKFFQREAAILTTGDQHYTTAMTTADLARQPSKAGVLSNLLKLQRNTRPHKHHPVVSRPKPRKEKQPKRPTLYSRSANNSLTSLTTKSVFGTYPPLPATSNGLSPTATLSNFQPHPRSGNRHSIHFDNVFAQSFSAMTTPLQSPNASPRGSISGGELTPGGGSYFVGGNSSGSGGGSPPMSLSSEEQLRITIAVAHILERQDYILRLAKSLIKYGSPSHRLEDAIDRSARTLEINLQCVYLPNVMIVAFTDYETHTSETHLLKVSADLDMYKCALVHQVHKMVTHSAMPVEEAIMKLDAINAEKDANPRWLTVLAYATASFCTAPMFFKGSWIDAGVSFLIGGAVGLLVWLAERVPSYARICEITMSVVVAFIAEALRNSTHICEGAVKLAGIVIILPGYTITCAILELSSRHIISGSVRLFYAIVFSLLLGYGLTIGASIWALFDHSARDDEKFSADCATAPLDPKWNILFVPLFAISLNIWLKAHSRQWFLATVLSIVGYVVSYTSSTFGGAKTEVSSALAAFAIGFLGNVYQRLTRQLSFQAVVCAVFFLVPGSIGLKGALAWFTDDMPGGVSFALQMVVTAIAISVGLFASALVVYPMGKTRSAQMTF